MTAKPLPHFPLSTPIWTAVLAAVIVFSALQVRALTQAQKPPASATASVPQRSGGQGANQGSTGASSPGRGGPWWRDESIKKELVLTADQTRRLDSLFERRAKDLEPLNDELDKQRAELNRLMSDRNAGAAAIALQVARLEVPRAKMNESFYVMMYRMSLVLDPEQNKKLQAIFDRTRDRGRN